MSLGCTRIGVELVPPVTPNPGASLTQPFLHVVSVKLVEVSQVLYPGQILILVLEGLHSGGVFLLTKRGEGVTEKGAVHGGIWLKT
jgi:hypothetical protein